MGPLRYAEAPTVYEAVNELLGRHQATSEASADSSQLSALLTGLLCQKSNAGTFDLAGQLASGRTLLVGDGNLSFSLALCKLELIDPRTVLTSTFETTRRVVPGTIANASRLRALGARVMHGVDATDLRKFVGSSRFTTIMFNFPNTASRTPVYGHNPNHHLVRRFLRGAAQHLVPKGCITVTTVDSSFYAGAFGMDAAAKFAGLPPPKAYDFRPHRFSGYSHVNTVGDGSALSRYRRFKMWVFRAT